MRPPIYLFTFIPHYIFPAAPTPRPFVKITSSIPRNNALALLCTLQHTPIPHSNLPQQSTRCERTAVAALSTAPSRNRSKYRSHAHRCNPPRLARVQIKSSLEIVTGLSKYPRPREFAVPRMRCAHVCIKPNFRPQPRVMLIRACELSTRGSAVSRREIPGRDSVVYAAVRGGGGGGGGGGGEIWFLIWFRLFWNWARWRCPVIGVCSRAMLRARCLRRTRRV